MKLSFAPLVLAGAALATAIAVEQDASACGGCFHMDQPNETTQVSGHRMIFSISEQQTTLWDQIEYTGDPSEFAWVLPIHGQVDVQLSADALFTLLDDQTDPVVQPPGVYCSGGFGCGTGSASSKASSVSSTGSGPVTVIANDVVGPYETVQLSSTDPTALTTWLTSHGYAIPPDIQPVIDAYVAEGSNFLAIRLVPGRGIAAMRPVRVTSPGAGLTLPLRMVAAGTGSITPIKLWVFGQGRYEPVGVPVFKIDPAMVSWDYATQQSNMASLRESGFATTNNTGWLVDYAEHVDSFFFAPLTQAVDEDPIGLGYGDDAMGTNASANLAADLDALIGHLGSTGYLTRVDAELSRPALESDLLLGAAADQLYVSNVFVPGLLANKPTCPPPPDCSGSGYGGYGGGYSDDSGGSGCTCSLEASSGVDGALAGALGVAALIHLRQRSRRRHDREAP